MYRLLTSLNYSVTAFMLLVLLQAQAKAQLYADSLFNEIEVSTHYYLRQGDELLGMDVYLPTDNEREDKPFILFVHGGGFARGTRDEPRYVDLCQRLAYRGYAVASISYSLLPKGTLFNCDLDAEIKKGILFSTASQTNKAAAYAIQQKEKWGIDAGKIILCGSSAGAEAVLHAAYTDSLKMGVLPKYYKYAGVISMAGAITDLELITAENAIPTQLFHGTCDNSVPYASASHHYCKEEDAGYLPLHGGYSIMQRLHELEKPYFLMTGCSDNHDWFGIPFKKEFSQVIDFLYHDVMEGEKRQIHLIRARQTDYRRCMNEHRYNFCR